MKCLLDSCLMPICLAVIQLREREREREREHRNLKLVAISLSDAHQMVINQFNFSRFHAHNKQTLLSFCIYFCKQRVLMSIQKNMIIEVYFKHFSESSRSPFLPVLLLPFFLFSVFVRLNPQIIIIWPSCIFMTCTVVFCLLPLFSYGRKRRLQVP